MNIDTLETLIKQIAAETARTPPLDGASAHLRAARDLLAQHAAIQANPETAVKAPPVPAAASQPASAVQPLPAPAVPAQPEKEAQPAAPEQPA